MVIYAKNKQGLNTRASARELATKLGRKVVDQGKTSSKRWGVNVSRQAA